MEYFTELLSLVVYEQRDKKQNLKGKRLLKKCIHRLFKLLRFFSVPWHLFSNLTNLVPHRWIFSGSRLKNLIFLWHRPQPISSLRWQRVTRFVTSCHFQNFQWPDFEVLESVQSIKYLQAWAVDSAMALNCWSAKVWSSRRHHPSQVCLVATPRRVCSCRWEGDPHRHCRLQFRLTRFSDFWDQVRWYL